MIIDEAAAIPLPLVRNLIGPYLVFMASTINGYEGTGRSLSLKLIQQLREGTRVPLSEDITLGQEDVLISSASTSKKAAHKAAPKARTLREIKLETPIRYSAGDQIEKWLNGLLCLDANIIPRAAHQGCPHPSICELFYVNRDTLFSFHPASEVFLHRMMALYVASHYKNQPNDLQLMSDAPAHHLFVLLPPIDDNESHLPEPLVVLQVALEGNISKQAILDGLSRGLRAGGDLIPWSLMQQFQENKFALLSGARIVRIATHPDYSNVSVLIKELINVYKKNSRWVMVLEPWQRSIHFTAANTSTSMSPLFPRHGPSGQVQLARYAKRIIVGRRALCHSSIQRYCWTIRLLCERPLKCRRCFNDCLKGSQRLSTILGFRMA